MNSNTLGTINQKLTKKVITVLLICRVVTMESNFNGKMEVLTRCRCETLESIIDKACD